MESTAAPTRNEIKAINKNFPFNFVSGLSDLKDSRVIKIPVVKNISIFAIRKTITIVA